MGGTADPLPPGTGNQPAKPGPRSDRCMSDSPLGRRSVRGAACPGGGGCPGPAVFRIRSPNWVTSLGPDGNGGGGSAGRDASPRSFAGAAHGSAGGLRWTASGTMERSPPAVVQAAPVRAATPIPELIRTGARDATVALLAVGKVSPRTAAGLRFGCVQTTPGSVPGGGQPSGRTAADGTSLRGVCF